MVRSKSAEALAEKEQEDGSSLVPHLRSTMQSRDLSGLSDDKYAIAESILEAERESCPNWMQTKHLQFEKDHGQLMQMEEDGYEMEAEEELDEELLCQCPIDLCARDAEKLDDYQTWFEQCREVLRLCRSRRKSNGFIPDHPMIAVTPPGMEGVQDLKSGDEVYLMAKVSFAPFDAALVRFKLERLGPECLCAKLQGTNEGLPDVISFDLFLKLCCETFDGESDKIQIVHYSGGRKFGELDIQSMEAIEQAVQRVASQAAARDTDLDDEQRDAKKRADLLKKALAAGSNKAAKAKSKAGPKPGPKAKGVKKNTKQKQKPSKDSKESPLEGQEPEALEGLEVEDPDEPGLAGAMHRAIEQEWAGALEANLPQASSSHSSSSSSHAPEHPVDEQPVVDPAPALPWKDSLGHCFLPKDGVQKGTHLGAQLSMLN